MVGQVSEPTQEQRDIAAQRLAERNDARLYEAVGLAALAELVARGVAAERKRCAAKVRSIMGRYAYDDELLQTCADAIASDDGTEGS